MYPLAVVEEHLSSIESWPSSFITDMFDSEPAVRVSRRAAAFLYGNRVNVSDAVKLYRACNNAWKAIAETYTYSCYFHWEKGDPIKYHMFYYNMKKECVMRQRRDEGVKPEIIVRDIGLARCRWSGMIGLRFEYVRMSGIERGMGNCCDKRCLLVE